MYKISKITSNTTVDFAAEELKKYMRMMMPRCGEINTAYIPEASDGIRIGLMADFGLDMNDADDITLDDIIYIDMTDDGGIIAGSNPVSTLIAVYRFLRFCGCRWLFPGIDGEWIPMIDKLPDVNYRHMADHRYRGQCNEGAEYQTNMIETIDFTPKIGMNSYMLEFDNPRAYYDSYYTHELSMTREDESVHPDTILQWKRQCEAEIQKRGLHFHDMGHGWTAEPFGIDSSMGWRVQDDNIIPDETRNYLAEMNGVRKLHDGVSLNTNICMSNPDARKMMSNYIADYAEKQNNVDFLHIWLADGSNNHCECDNCNKMRPSDWYIILLNEIDAELTRRSLDTHLVFIVYVDSFWPPMKEKLNNDKRFTMLFAPITRLYTESYELDSDPAAVTDYEKNKCVFPRGMAACTAYLDEWKKDWTGDCFCYEYHFMDFQYQDVSSLYMSELIHRDIISLKKHGLSGIIEDGSQRSYFPTGLNFYTYGETLFDTSLKFEDIETDYFTHAYGENWKKALDYLKEVNRLLPFNYLFGDVFVAKQNSGGKYYNPDMAENAEELRKLSNEFAPVIKANLRQYYRASAVSWQILKVFNEMLPLMADIVELKCTGRDIEALDAIDALILYGSEKEIYIERYYDHYLFARAWSRVAEGLKKVNSNLND